MWPIRGEGGGGGAMQNVCVCVCLYRQIDKVQCWFHRTKNICFLFCETSIVLSVGIC